MSESKKNARRNSLLEFELPNALLAATSEKIGSRKLARLTPEERSKIIGALNTASSEIGKIVGEGLASKRAGSTTRRSRKTQADQGGQSAGGDAQ